MFKSTAYLFIFFIIVIFVLISCSENRSKNVTRGVYYWRTVLDLDQNEFDWIKENDITKIYTRFFDVNWDPSTNQPLPVGSLKIISNKLLKVEIIPTVFITNNTLLNIPDSSINDLAKNIFVKIKSQAKRFSSKKIKEIQLDCDWTKKTKVKYFNLIKSIRKFCDTEEISISATIRLHQVKYFEETGVPPVDRGSLMFYNMSSVSNPNTKNSIFDEDIARKYLVNFDRYPLKLDVILPAFSWGVLFRHNRISDIINDVNFEELNDNDNIKQLKSNLFSVKKNFYLHERYLKKNDQIRVEEITPETTELAAKLIAPYINNDSLVVSIYHLNEEVIKNYDTGVFQNIISAFR